MRWLIVTPIYPPDIGGPATYVPALAVRLAKDHQVTVVTWAKKSSRSEKQQGVSVFRVGIAGGTVGRQAKLLQTVWLQAKGADLIYAQGALVVGLISWLVAKLRSKPLLIKFVGDEIWETEFNAGRTTLGLEEFYAQKRQLTWRLRFMIGLQRWVLPRANKVIVPSQYLANFLYQTFQVPTRKVAVIANAVEYKKIDSPRQNKQLLVVGRLVKTKQIDMVIRAMREKGMKGYRLLIAGDGPERMTLEEMIVELKLEKRVFLLGRLAGTEVVRQMATAAAVINLSRYEGQSHTAIQALLTQTPLVVSDLLANRELLGGKAIYFSGRSEVKLAKAIIAAIEKCPRVGENDGWQKQFLWATHLNRLVKVGNQFSYG